METELKSIRTANLEIGSLTIKVHVLNNGQRIIEEQSLIDFVEYLQNGKITPKEADEFAKEFKKI